jgi:hypothetical protein
MNPLELAKWQAKALKAIAKPLLRSCPYCKAAAGELCRTKKGIEVWEASKMHSARLSAKVNYRYARFG